MKRTSAKTIERRNRRELAGCAVVIVGLLYTVGLTLRSLPVLGGVAFVAWFIVKHARWQANDADLLGVRRELIRQGRIAQLAWAWYVVPCALPVLVAEPVPLSFPMKVIFIGGSIFIAWLNYRTGTRLIEEAHC